MTTCVHRLVVASALALAACGSGGGGGGDHSTPGGAVQGFIAALAGNSDIGPALQWVAPSERSLLSELQGIKFNISVEDFAVVSTTADPHDPNRAVVHVKGSVRYCFSGTPAGVPINTCEPFPFSAASRSDTVGAVKVNGDWYVSFTPAGPAPNPTLSCSGVYSSMPAPECTPTSSPSPGS